MSSSGCVSRDAVWLTNSVSLPDRLPRDDREYSMSLSLSLLLSLSLSSLDDERG